MSEQRSEQLSLDADNVFYFGAWVNFALIIVIILLDIGSDKVQEFLEARTEREEMAAKYGSALGGGDSPSGRVEARVGAQSDEDKVKTSRLFHRKLSLDMWQRFTSEVTTCTCTTHAAPPHRAPPTSTHC